jgi:phosphoadenosine phosphosulfate reductase
MKALAFSGGKDSMACLHLLRDELACAIYVDTGYAYPETQRLVEYAAGLVPMHVVKACRGEAIPSDVVPVNWTANGQIVTGPKSCVIQSYLDCCFQNIAVPLLAKANELGVSELFDGERAAEGHKSPSLDGESVYGVVRRHPIRDWTEREVLDYLATKMEIPAHYSIKHSSLDCYDCTAYRNDSVDRVTWMKDAHPQFFERYLERARALDQAIGEALW